jgi:hypothetical protein
MSARILAAALAYAAHGLAVFPVPPDRKKSYKSAEHSDGSSWGMTREPAEIRADFARWPNARIGIPTGTVNRIVVIETDTIEGHDVDGAASFAQLEVEHGLLPDTGTACSPSVRFTSISDTLVRASRSRAQRRRSARASMSGPMAAWSSHHRRSISTAAAIAGSTAI